MRRTFRSSASRARAGSRSGSTTRTRFTAARPSTSTPATRSSSPTRTMKIISATAAAVLFAAATTTELLQFNGVPFVRAGAFTDDVRTGVESIMSKKTTVSVEAHFEQARFDASQTYANLLLGGNSIGGDVTVHHRLSERTSL